MWVPKKDDSTVMRAVEAANRNDHRQAEKLYQEAANQYRNPKEKETLWKAAKRHRDILNSD